jgi:hypothetical protein
MKHWKCFDTRYLTLWSWIGGRGKLMLVTRQHSHPWFRVPRSSWPYFSKSKLCYNRRSVKSPSGAQEQIFVAASCRFVDERTCPSFTIVSGPRQGCHSWVGVPRDSWPHITVSDSRLPQPGGRYCIDQPVNVIYSDNHTVHIQAYSLWVESFNASKD